MKSFLSIELLNELKTITEQNVQFVRDRLKLLSPSQLNWKKDAKSWSVNEILAHLNEYASYYNKTMALKIERTRFREPRERFMSSPLGRSAWSAMKLGNARNIKRPVRSPKLYNPSLNSSIPLENAVSTFENGQIELIDILQKAEKVNLRKVRIPISISKIIRFRLGDALMFVVYHNERHIQQVANLLSTPEFPSNSKEA
ncbi:MAG: hypothetical protein RIT43_517 [Bacteroidota bacterium]|jgi:uncharacterized damage-inducible protein DinB